MSKINKGFSLYWALWIAVGFGIPEFLAWLEPAPGDTLSEQAWWIVAHPWGAWLLAVGFGLLLYHFFKDANWFGNSDKGD